MCSCCSCSRMPSISDDRSSSSSARPLSESCTLPSAWRRFPPDCRSLPVHIENLIFGAENLLRVAMALHAPLHQQRVGLEHQRHLVDLSVARRAAHALVDMNAVIEIDEIGQAVNFDPLDGFIAAITLA